MICRGVSSQAGDSPCGDFALKSPVVYDSASIFHRRSLDSFVTIIDGIVQDCNNSSALAMELPQSCAKPSIALCKSLIQAVQTPGASFINLV